MATHRRSVSWLSFSSVRRSTTTPPPPPPPPARSDSIRPPAFKPFRTLSSAQPQKPTWPPTTIGATAPEQRAQTPQPPHVQRPPFRSATATTKPAAASPPAAVAAQRSSPPPPNTLTITSPAISNTPKAPPTTTSPALKSSQPITTSIPTSPITTTNLSSTPTNLQQFNNSSAETEHKSVLVQQVTEKSNYATSKHHKLQSTAQIAKAGVAFEEKAVIPMQRKHHGMRIVRLVGDNIGAAMVVNSSSRNKYDYGANKPLSIQDKTSTNATLFINSNVQGVNNSIAFDSCLSHQDPGLHCTFEP